MIRGASPNIVRPGEAAGDEKRLFLSFFLVNLPAMKHLWSLCVWAWLSLMPLWSQQPIEVRRYDLEVKINAELKRVAGTSEITFTATSPCEQVSFDLHHSLRAARVRVGGKEVSYRQLGDAVTVSLPDRLRRGDTERVAIVFAGSPLLAKDPPASSGAVWDRDERGRPLVSLLGAAWWPNLPAPADTMQLQVIFEKGLKVLAPGELLTYQPQPGEFRQWTFVLGGPIRPSELSLHIGNYISQKLPLTYQGRQRTLGLHLLVDGTLPAKEDTERLQRMLQYLDRYWGPCAAWNQGLHLPETAYWRLGAASEGEETLGQTGLFASLASFWLQGWNWSAAPEDSWIQPVVSAYAALSYAEQTKGTAATRQYLEALKAGRMDETAQGLWLFHSLRELCNNQVRWERLLRDMGPAFSAQPLTTQALEDYFSQALSNEVTALFRQFLGEATWPVLEYRYEKKRRKLTFSYRWVNVVPDFELAAEVYVEGTLKTLFPTTEWQSFTEKGLDRRNIVIKQQTGLYEVEEVN